MVCRIAYLISMPEIKEEIETEVQVFDSKRKKWEKHYQPSLIPRYSVTYLFDFGMRCGVDDWTIKFPTREDAERDIQKVLDNEHDWIRYDAEYIDH